MFCNRCGKTVKSDELTCSHCGATIGDNRFTSASYTSAQPRVPVEAAQVEGDERFPPYTRTTYMSEREGDASEGDALTRTTYRPLLRDEPGDRPDEQPEEFDEAPGEAPGEAPDEAPDEAPSAGGADEAEPEPAPRPSRLPPVRKAGISPEVRRHMQQLEEERRKSAEKARGRVNQPAAGEGGEAAPGGEEGWRSAIKLPFDIGKLASKRAMTVAALSVLVLVILVGGVVWVGHVMNASRAKLPGVTPDTYEQGLALLESYQTADYRAELAALYAEGKFTDVSDRQKRESADLSALLPETPAENDQAFVDALLAVKQSIDNTVALDAIAMGTSADGTLGARAEASERDWGLIAQGTAGLKAATTLEQMNAAAGGAAVAFASTPAPDDTGSTAKYSTLRNGMMNSSEVRNLQTRLRELGFFNAEVDGSFGTKTETAVKRFQSAAGLQVDGVATPALQELLFSDQAPRRQANTATPKPTAPAETPQQGEGQA